jgi:microcystin-dependent protein
MANYTKSTNFTAKDSLPTGDSARIVKGTEIDTEFTAISAAIASKADSNSPTFTGTPAAPTATAGTNTTQLATTAFATAAALAAFPAGGIIMWSGSIAAIPSGWALCNGSSGTPDLRDRFVIGAGTTYAVNATGGSANATLPSHTHTATNTISNAAHQHYVVHNAAGSNEGSLNSSNYMIRRGIYGGDFSYDFSSTGSEANIGLTSTAGGSLGVSTAVSTVGASAVNANLPPYLALAYIMKL